MKKHTYVVIMAGGIGSRLWPSSRSSHPKQFIDILGIGKSLLQMTYDRFLSVCPKENIYVVTNSAYSEIIHKQLPDLEKHQIMTEPVGRNTAPCIAYASYKIKKEDEKANIIVSPSDHAILKEEEFTKVIETSLEAVSSDEKLITIGIKPHKPETGYGYIQFLHGSKGEIKKVKTFTEKPNLELAEKFVESGEYVWNSGIFIWNVKSIVKAFENYLPEMAEIFESGDYSYYTKHEDSFIKNAYSMCKNISIDYGIMEKATNVYVVLGNFGWSDLGSWSSVHELRKKDKSQNVLEGNIQSYDTKNSIIRAFDEKLVVVQGLEDYLVVDSKDVLLICKKGDDSMIKEFAKDSKRKWGNKYL